LTDAAGRRLGEAAAGPANLTLGIDVAVAAIVEASERAFTAANLVRDAMGRTHAGIGLAGASVLADTDTVRARLPLRAVAIASDAVTACLGAHGGDDGGILILGTGSHGLAIIEGKPIRIGGWGFAISDDASGAILGRAVVRAAVAAFDGLAPASALTDTLMAEFGGDPTAIVKWAIDARPHDYAAFAPLVLRHADHGDPVAAALLANAIDAAARMVDRLLAVGITRVALMGGLAATFGARLPARLAPFIVEAQGDALDGAIMLAREQMSLRGA
jgi:glucosamine kinase